jgi:hypothetical protein
MESIEHVLFNAYKSCTCLNVYDVCIPERGCVGYGGGAGLVEEELSPGKGPMGNDRTEGALLARETKSGGENCGSSSGVSSVCPLIEGKVLFWLGNKIIWRGTLWIKFVEVKVRISHPNVKYK